MPNATHEWDWDELAVETSPVVALRAGASIYEALAVDARAMFLGFALPEMVPGKVLEVGCGKGQWLAMLAAHHVRTVGGDRSFPMLRQARATSDVVQFDATSLPFADRTFENSFTVTVLQHLTQPLAAVAELARVTRARIVIEEMTWSPVPRRFTPETFARSRSWYERAFADHNWRLRSVRRCPRPGLSTLVKAMPRSKSTINSLPRAVGLAIVTHTWFVFEPAV